MKSKNFSQFGFATGLFFVAIYLICLAWSSFMSTPEMTELHQLLLAMTFPGFTWLTAGSFVWGAFLSFVYGFLGVGLFSLIKSLCCSSKKSCCN